MKLKAIAVTLLLLLATATFFSLTTLSHARFPEERKAGLINPHEIAPTDGEPYDETDGKPIDTPGGPT